jgi:type II secretory pathway pseudopilin PulG
MDPNIDSPLANALIEIAMTVISLLFTVGAGYAVSAIKAVRDKNALLKLALSDARIEQLVQDSIRTAEETVAAEVKAGVSKGYIKGAASARKFSMAVAAVLDKVPGIDTDEAERLVTANLSKVGAGAAAALREVAAAARN